MFCNTFWTIPNQSMVKLCQRVGWYYIRIMAIISDMIFLVRKIELIYIMKIMMMKKSSQYLTTKTVKKQQKIMSFAGDRLPDQDEGRSAYVLDLHAWYGALENVFDYIKDCILTYFGLNHQGKAERTKQRNLLWKSHLWRLHNLNINLKAILSERRTTLRTTLISVSPLSLFMAPVQISFVSSVTSIN